MLTLFMNSNKSKEFLTAEWRKLVLANYIIDSDILKKYLPANVELDLWQGKCYVSFVGFMFLNTKVKGISFPFHKNFEEVNLRFYVKHITSSGELRRGVVFVKEIVPRHGITFIANSLFSEKYQTMKMKHSWKENENELQVSYEWNFQNKWNSLSVIAGNEPSYFDAGSEAEFITEHYWGYTKVSDNVTSEYGVEHPKWKIYNVRDYSIDADFGALYGEEFCFLSSAKPDSVMLAEGSDIIVRAGRKL